MSAATSQAFRAQSSSKVITIPTRHDNKSNQRVIRWKDIQLHFKDAQYVVDGEDIVLFLTDDDLEDLIPLRIAHHPGAVLKVVVMDEGIGDAQQGDSSSMIQHMDRDVANLRISDADNNQALVVRSQGHTATVAVQRIPSTSAGHYQQGIGDNVTLQEQLHQLQQQIEGILGKMQQTDQQTQYTQQQIQDQVDKILQSLQQTDRQHAEDTQRMMQQLDLHRQQLEGVLRTTKQQLDHQIEMVQQKTQLLEQDTQNTHQQMCDIWQQAQQQMDRFLNNIQELGQKAQHSEQQHNQLLQQMHGMAKARQDHRRSSPQLGRQGTQYTFNQFVHAQCRVQAVLATPSPDLPIPRLFIILPTTTTAVDEQGGSCSLAFRLFFLCECGSHTMAKDCNKPHEIHLMNHPGYDIINQDEFINKYGPYLLTMMYMVKYGAKTRGLVVPPLLGLNRAIGEGESIGQLVDDTITHLKEVTGCMDGDTTAHNNLDTMELTELKSHLKVKDGEGASGGLYRIEIQKAHYPWICSDHLRECYESTLQQLKHHINAGGGVWKWNEAKVKVTSEAMTWVFFCELGKLFRIKSVENWRSTADTELKPDDYQLMPNSTAHTLSGPDGLHLLSLDFGRFTMAVKGISRGEVKDVAISIGDLNAPTLDDMEFIQQCRPTSLTILGTPQVKDENRLVSFLQHNPSISSIRTDCSMMRCMALIDLVKSTRENMLQGEDKPALRDLELVHPEIKVKVSFFKGSPMLVVEACIKMENRSVEPAECTFIRHDSLAKLLDQSVQEGGSRITHLDMAPTSLTTLGLDAMNRVINLSPYLTYLRLSFEKLGEKERLEKALDLLRRHKDRLTSLQLEGWGINSWLSRIANTFPKHAFPALTEYFVHGDGVYLNDCRWVTAMSSAQPQQRRSLKAFGVHVYLHLEQWGLLLKTIDLSALEELHFSTKNGGGFTQQQLRLLVNHIVDNGAPSSPLRLLNLTGTEMPSNDMTRELFARLREKVPDIEITGI
ncbi:hypothetical protein BGX34_011565 [Mortierella sp. NVP85]|nr:hypothetical protein BGX34_011565 [Mortierella sp. NVP85]